MRGGDIMTNEEIFEALWKDYPKKAGKSAVSKKAKAEIISCGYERVKAALDNYKRNKESWRAWLDGSTFFNGRWKDWENYIPEESTNPQTFPQHKSNYEERQYSEAFLNSFIGGDIDDV